MDLSVASRRYQENVWQPSSADVDEMLLPENATDGIKPGLAGIDWMPGDEIITTRRTRSYEPSLLYFTANQGVSR